MSKFERAKKQTIKNWEWELAFFYNIEDNVDIDCPRCGFCDYYRHWEDSLESTKGYGCSDCPIYFDLGRSCSAKNSIFEKWTDGKIDPMAILIYVHQLQPPAPRAR